MSHVWRAPAVILFSAAVILGLNMGIRQTFGLFLEPMTEALQVGRGSFALAIAVQNLIWGVVTPFFGMVADRYGTGRMLVAGGLIYASGILLMAWGESLTSLHLGAGILVGLGVSASGFPLVLAAVARSFSDAKRSMALGIASAGGSAGQFLLLPGTQEMISGFGWVNALLVLAVLSLLIVPLAASLAGKPSAPTSFGEMSLSEQLRSATRHRGYILLTAGFFVCGFHVAFIATHLPAYIVSCNLSPQVGATALGLIGFFNILGGLLAGVLGGRFRKKNVLSLIYLARAATIALFLMSPKNDIAVYLFSASFGFLWLSTVPLTSGLVGHLFGPRFMATLFGIVMFSHQIGAFFGAWLGGVAYDATGSYDLVWYISVGLGVLAALLHWPIQEERVRLAESTA